MASKIYNKNNMSTSEVKKMQQALVDAGYSVGSSGVDGIWGKDTEKALSQFKSDTGGSNTYGTTVGNETFNKLYGTGSSGSTTTPATSSGSTSGSGIGGALQTIAGLAQQVASNPTLQNGALGYTALNNSFDSQLDTLNAGYENYVSQLQGGANNANAALDKARQNALAGIKSTYDDTARNYYRLYRTQEKELPEKLSAVGATGGASESAALALMSNYSDNLRQNETARNRDTNALNEDYYNAVANNSKQLASQIADAYLKQAQDVSSLENQRYSQQQDLIRYYANQLAEQAAADSESDLANYNAAQNAAIAKLKASGNTVYTYKDANGRVQYEVKGKSGSSGKDSSDSGNDGGYTPTGTYSYSDIVKAINNGNLSGANSMAYSAATGGSINQAQANLIASTLAQIAAGYTTTKKSTGSTKKK